MSGTAGRENTGHHRDHHSTKCHPEYRKRINMRWDVLEIVDLLGKHLAAGHECDELLDLIILVDE